MSEELISESSPQYEKLQQVNRAKNLELSSIAEEIEKGSKPQIDPFAKLQSVNKKQYQEYLNYTSERDRNKHSAEAFFAYGPRFMLIVVILLILAASVAYVAVLSKL